MRVEITRQAEGGCQKFDSPVISLRDLVMHSLNSLYRETSKEAAKFKSDTLKEAAAIALGRCFIKLGQKVNHQLTRKADNRTENLKV